MADIKVKLYNFQGKEIGEENLDQVFFGRKIVPAVISQAVIAQAANSRQILAHTKGRAEVRGGGRKPWKQKGTGRARHGSTRSPLWVGGGVTFGPTADRNFSLRINKKTKTKALQMVFSDKVANDRFILVDKYDDGAAKTKTLAKSLTSLPIKKQSVLIVTENAQDKIVLSAKNLKKINTIYYGSLNIRDLLKHEYLLVSQNLLAKIVQHYS
jgi:large subunit ribosomal protein L4